MGLLYAYGITREELAAYVGYSADYVSMILRGVRTPPEARETIENAVKEMILKR